MKIPIEIKSEDDIISVFEKSFEELQKNNPKKYLSPRTHSDLRVAFVEAIANVIKHAGELDQKGVVTGQLFLDEKTLGFEVFDHGPGFGLNEVPVPDLNDFQSSGRGVFMMKQLSDSLEYKKKLRKNVLTFKRHLLGYEETTRGLDLLYELSEAIIRNVSLDEVYQIILEQALELFNVERASILIYDETVKALRMVASRGISDDVKKKTTVRAGDGVSGYVYQHGRPLLIEDVDSNKRGIEKKDHYKTRSFISAPMVCSPLRYDEKPIGVINLTDRLDGKEFTKKDLKLLSTIANQAMACVYIKGLVEEIKTTVSLKQEMEQIRKIQSSYLPKKPPVIKNYSLAGRCEMAQSVGGDYFDYFYEKPYLFLVVADVSGHDVSSAVTMVNFRSQLKSILKVSSNPGEILSQLNNSIYDDLQNSEQFVSCLLIKLNTETGVYEMANSGHYPPLLFKGTTPLVESGLVMGIEQEEEYNCVEGKLAVGDEMVLFTDGVVESMNDEGKMFGLEKLQKSMDHFEKDALTRVHRIIGDVLKYRNVNQALDDITVVSVSRLN